MGSFSASCFLLFLLFARFSAVDISPSSGSVCLGQIAQWTCTTNGTNRLSWRHSVFGVGPSFTDSSSVGQEGSFGGFVANLTNVCGSQYISTATVNVSSALNGTSLDCADGLFGISMMDSASILVEDSSTIISYFVGTQSSNTIFCSWSGAECIKSYLMTVTNSSGQQVDSGSLSPSVTSFSYTPTVEDTYTFNVTGYNYFGRIATSVEKVYRFTRYTFTVQAISSITDNFTRATLFITIQVNNDNNLPPMTSCNLIVSNSTGMWTRSCVQERVIRFDDVAPGETYAYTVTITNIVGPSIATGSERIQGLPSCTSCPQPSLSCSSCPTVSCSLYSSPPCSLYPPSCSPYPSPVCSPNPSPAGPPCETPCNEKCSCCIILISCAVLLFLFMVGFIIGYLCWKKYCNEDNNENTATSCNQVATADLPIGMYDTSMQFQTKTMDADVTEKKETFT